MNSIINEILLLRKDRTFEYDSSNSNKYCIVAKEDDGTKTAYCFGTPIYDSTTRKLLNLSFSKKEDEWYYDGSNSHISIKENICLFDRFGNEFCIRTFSTWNKMEEYLYAKDIKLYPTLNGVLMKLRCDDQQKAKIRLATDTTFKEQRLNNKCLSFMKEDFLPYLTISLWGGITLNSEMIPCTMDYKKTENEYVLTFESQDPQIVEIIVDVNIYDGKLFQDTTVESADPTANNVFGGIAYIGKTNLYGDQWLYSRIDFSKIAHLLGRKANKLILHIPQLNKSMGSLSVYPVSLRFCSFGSNWNNKSPFSNRMKETIKNKGYQSIDITEYYKDMLSGRISQKEGLIIKNDNSSNYVVVSTGDNAFSPQILEIQYK